MASMTTNGAVATETVDTCETGIFVGGIQEFIKYFGMDSRTDPVVVAGRLMREIDCYSTINRIHLADRAVNKTNRHQARAVIIYLNSTYHKRQVAAYLKAFLKDTRIPATVADVFPQAEAKRAQALTRLAAEKRRDKSMTRTRVVNRSGAAVLQHTTNKDTVYKDTNVPDEELEPYYQPKTGRREEGRDRGRPLDRSGDRNYSSRDEREMRDREKADRRGDSHSNSHSNSHNNSNYNRSQLPQRSQLSLIHI